MAAMKQTVSSKEIVDKYFCPAEDDVWKCKCGKERKKGRGWSNLLEHISRDHAETLEQAKLKDGAPINFFRKKDMKLFSWVEWIVKDLLPFSFCEKATTRKFSRLENVSIEGLMQSMQRLQVQVENKIRKILPSQFAIMFDGWSSGGTHFLAVFALYDDASHNDGYNRALLSFAPLADEEHMDADSHWDSIYEILTFYGKNFLNVSCLIADNCSTNKSFARKADLYFVGCASHRLNLGVKILLQDYKDVLDGIQNIMVYLRTLKARAALRLKTTFAPVLCNVTRWSSTQKMVERYLKLLPFIGDIVPSDLQMSPRDNETVQGLNRKLSDVNVLTKELQDESVQLYEVRDYLDAAIQEFPELASHCSETSNIVCDPEFETAVVKVQRSQMEGDALSLSRSEKNAVKHLLKPQELAPRAVIEEEEDDNQGLMAAIRRLKKRKTSDSDSCMASNYIDLRFIRPTTNICERMFSVSGFTFCKTRQGLLPSNLEMQLFLKGNEHLWDEKLFMTSME